MSKKEPQVNVTCHQMYIVPVWQNFGTYAVPDSYIGPFPSVDLAELWSIDVDDRYWHCGKPIRLYVPGLDCGMFTINRDANAMEQGG